MMSQPHNFLFNMKLEPEDTGFMVLATEVQYNL